MLLLHFSQEDQRLSELIQPIIILIYLSLFAISIIGECLHLVFRFIVLMNLFSFYHLLHQTLHFIEAFLGLRMASIEDDN
jgi:hypothetical protein